MTARLTGSAASTNPRDVHPGELGVPAQGGAQRAGAQPRHQRHRGAQPAGGHRDVEGVAARARDVLRRGPLGAGAGLGDGQQVDDQLAQDAQRRDRVRARAQP